MSETPLTDAEDLESKWDKPESKYQGMRDLSRKLERKLTAMTARAEKAEAKLRALCSSCPNIIEAGVKLGQALVEIDALKAQVSELCGLQAKVEKLRRN